MGITFTTKGDYKLTTKFLNAAASLSIPDILKKYGEEGRAALAANTPVDSSLTANSWYYDIMQGNGTYEIVWKNSNTNAGVNIAIILQYGHGTGTGGYVEGRDYINSAVQPIFDAMADAVWREVMSL